MPLTLFSGQGPSRPVAVAPPVGRQVAASGMDATSKPPLDTATRPQRILFGVVVWACVGPRSSGHRGSGQPVYLCGPSFFI